MGRFLGKPVIYGLCPTCGKDDFDYGRTVMNLLGESIKALPALTVSGGPLLIGTLVATGGSGLGIFSIPKDFYQSVFLKIPNSPVLVCTHCRTLAITCPGCKAFLALEQYPGVAVLINCPECKLRFGHCDN